MKHYVVVHEHKYGTSVHPFISEKDWTEPTPEEQTNLFYTLGMDYEPEKGEDVQIILVEQHHGTPVIDHSGHREDREATRKKLYIIAHTVEDVEMTIETFYTPEETVQAMWNIMDDDYEEAPQPDDDPEEYLERFKEWAREERDNFSDACIELQIVEL